MVRLVTAIVRSCNLFRIDPERHVGSFHCIYDSGLCILCSILIRCGRGCDKTGDNIRIFVLIRYRDLPVSGIIAFEAPGSLQLITRQGKGSALKRETRIQF